MEPFHSGVKLSRQNYLSAFASYNTAKVMHPTWLKQESLPYLVLPWWSWSLARQVGSLVTPKPLARAGCGLSAKGFFAPKEFLFEDSNCKMEGLELCRAARFRGHLAEVWAGMGKT